MIKNDITLKNTADLRIYSSKTYKCMWAHELTQFPVQV